MKSTASRKLHGRLHHTQTEQDHARRGTMIIWSIWVFLAMLTIAACSFNIMWLSCIRAEARRHAESAVIVAGHAFLSDDLLRPWQQPFENDGRVVRSRNAAVNHLRQSGGRTLGPMISENDVEFIQPPENTQSGNSGLTQPAATVPKQIRVTFGKGQSNDQLQMFFSGLTGAVYARIGVSAAATIEHSLVGFLPGGNATIPVLPFAIIDESHADGSALNAGGLWSQQIESGKGSDNLSWNPEKRAVEIGPDGLPELTLTLSPNSGGNKPDSFVPLMFAAASPTGSSSQTVDWMRNGITADDLKTLGLNELAVPSSMSVSTLSNGECTAIAIWLQPHAGQPFIVCLCHPTLAPPHSKERVTSGSMLSTVQLNRAVAARIMASEISASGEIRICLQPCVLITSTAVMSSAPDATLNRYVYSVRLCD